MRRRRHREYLEIWNADAWAKQEEELDAAAPEIAEGLAGAGAA
jgi:DNA-binding transcriptional regulator/RsmH inhibitor MraZ